MVMTNYINSGWVTLRQRLRKRISLPRAYDWTFNPAWIIRRPLFLEIKRFAPKMTGRILDFGCGNKPYENLFSCDSYVGLDLESSSHEFVKRDGSVVLYDGGRLPFPSRSFDGVVAFEVLDDLSHPSRQLSEIYRILEPGGYLLLSLTFIWEEHELPNDYVRFTSNGLSQLLRDANFEILELHKMGSSIEAISQLLCAYLYQQFSLKGPIRYVLCQIFLIAPITAMTIILRNLLPKRMSLFLGQICLARKPVQ